MSAHGVIQTAVGLVDLAPTLVAQMGLRPFDADGVDLSASLAGVEPAARDLYAETFAPLLDFGWSPLRSLRSGTFKYIAAPKPELFRLDADPAESRNLFAADAARAASLADRVDRISPSTLAAAAALEPDAAARLQSLGYVSGSPSPKGIARADPKDKRELAMRIAQVTSGELEGAALRAALEQILAEDPANPQAHVRLGYQLVDAQQCGAAERHFRAAIAGHLPGADAYLGLASCQAAAHQPDAAGATLRLAEAAEPGNPVVAANRGILLSDAGRMSEALPLLQRALALDPDFHEARFNLAVAYLRSGRRQDAAREATELLRRLPAAAPQRPEVQRLLATAQGPG